MIRVGWVEDTDLNLAALVIHDTDSDETLEVQRTLVPDEQDERLGMDTYCLVRGEATSYGGVEDYTLAGTTLSLKLPSEAARVLALPTSVDIDFGTQGIDVARQHLGPLLR